MELEDLDICFPLLTLMGIGRYSQMVKKWTKWSNDCGCQGHTCDVNGDYVRGHGLGRLPHLLFWGGEGWSLGPYHLPIKLRPLPSFTQWGLAPHGELRFVVLRR